MTRDGTATGQRIECTAGGQRGFTLVELMIAMLVGSLLIVLVFAIYTRMSVAYRTQSLLSETQQTLRTAREAIIADIRQTGFMIPAGVMLKDSLPGEPEPPLEVANSRGGTTTDAIRIFYADASARARVTTLGNGLGDIGFAQVDDLDQFQTGDVVVVVAMEGTDRSPTDATDIARFTPGCVVEVTGTTVGPPDTVEFGVAAVTYNTANNAHCDGLLDGSTGDVLPGAMMYRFVAHTYQLDETKLDEGVLERSPTGGLAGDDFVPLAFGFTDLQVATRYFEAGDVFDADGDGDAERDWYSSDTQHDPDPTTTRPAGAVLTQLTLSLAARTLTAVDTAVTAEQPAFIDPAEPDHNELGDKPAEVATGEHLYRYSTSRVDIRNLGVGR